MSRIWWVNMYCLVGFNGLFTLPVRLFVPIPIPILSPIIICRMFPIYSFFSLYRCMWLDLISERNGCWAHSYRKENRNQNQNQNQNQSSVSPLSMLYTIQWIRKKIGIGNKNIGRAVWTDRKTTGKYLLLWTSYEDLKVKPKHENKTMNNSGKGGVFNKTS